MRTGDAALIAGVTHLPARILNQFAVGNYRQRRFFSTDINVSLLCLFLPIVAAKTKRIQVSDKRFVIRWRRETSNKTASADFSRNLHAAYTDRGNELAAVCTDLQVFVSCTRRRRSRHVRSIERN